MLWRVFDTATECQAWCDAVWVTMVRRHASAHGGRLLDFGAGLVAVEVDALPDEELTAYRFPLLGKRMGEWVLDGGFTTAWATPQVTADGRWAAPCFDPADVDGQPEPAWPMPEPLPVTEPEPEPEPELVVEPEPVVEPVGDVEGGV